MMWHISGSDGHPCLAWTVHNHLKHSTLQLSPDSKGHGFTRHALSKRDGELDAAILEDDAVGPMDRVHMLDVVMFESVEPGESRSMTHET